MALLNNLYIGPSFIQSFLYSVVHLLICSLLRGQISELLLHAGSWASPKDTVRSTDLTLDSRVWGLRLINLLKHSTDNTTLITVFTVHEGPTSNGWQLLHDVIISWFPFFFLCSFSSPFVPFLLPLPPHHSSLLPPLCLCPESLGDYQKTDNNSDSGVQPTWVDSQLLYFLVKGT